MFDIIGKKKWFFAFSLLITIPGLIFILLTPFSGGKAGLKFSIDYTGGTVWSIRFADANVTPDQVRAELVVLGQTEATVTRTGSGFFDIRLTKLDLREVQPTPTPVPTRLLTPAPTVGPTATAPPSAAPTAAPTSSSQPAGSAAPTATVTHRMKSSKSSTVSGAGPPHARSDRVTDPERRPVGSAGWGSEHAGPDRGCPR